MGVKILEKKIVARILRLIQPNSSLCRTSFFDLNLILSAIEQNKRWWLLLVRKCYLFFGMIIIQNWRLSDYFTTLIIQLDPYNYTSRPLYKQHGIYKNDQFLLYPPYWVLYLSPVSNTLCSLKFKAKQNFPVGSVLQKNHGISTSLTKNVLAEALNKTHSYFYNSTLLFLSHSPSHPLCSSFRSASALLTYLPNCPFLPINQCSNYFPTKSIPNTTMCFALLPSFDSLALQLIIDKVLFTPHEHHAPPTTANS